MNIEFARTREPWDAYVDCAAPESHYHRWVWRDVIEETFGHQPYYLMAVEDGAIAVSCRSCQFAVGSLGIPLYRFRSSVTAE